MRKDLNYLDSVKFHSSLWREWLADKNLYSRLKSAIESRRSFLNLLKRYISHLIKEKKGVLKILEEGCGTAIDSCLLKKEYPDIDFYAIDLSQESIWLANKISNLLNASLKLSIDNIISTKFESDYFDMIFSQGLIEHFDDPVHVLSEQHRILKKDGILIISIPQRYSLFTVYKRSKMLFGDWKHGWEKEYSWRELASLGPASGFEVLEIDGHGFTIEDIFRNGIRKIENEFLNRYLLNPLVHLSNRIFFLIEILLGKDFKKRFCMNLVGAFKKTYYEDTV